MRKSVAVAAQKVIVVFLLHIIWTRRGGLLLVVVSLVEVEVVPEAVASRATTDVVLGAGARGNDKRLGV